MRLVTFKRDGRTRVGIWRDSEVVDLELAISELVPAAGSDEPVRFGSMIDFLRLGDRAMSLARVVMEHAEQGTVPPTIIYPLDDVSFLAPIPRPGKILAVDYNYPSFINDSRRFLQKKGVEVPEWHIPSRPWIFGKFSTTVIGPGECILKPMHTKCLDAEGELAVVVGKPGRFISEAEAWSYVAGYALFNDVSDRAVEFRLSPSINHRLFTLGKNNETFGPIGPCIFTPEEIPDPLAASLQVSVNGTTLYQYSLREAAYSIPALISFCSQLFHLDPGDVIATGSGGGCGAFREPPVYLQAGDTVRVRIDGLPALENRVEDEVV